MTLAYTIESCRNCLTRCIKLSKIKYSDRVAETCEACDRGRTCGVSSFFIPSDHCYKLNRNGGQLSELDGTEWLYPPGASSTGRASKGALQR